MTEAPLGVVGIIIAYLGIALAMLAVGTSVFWQGKALEKPEDHASIGKKLRTASFIWLFGAAVFFGIVVYLFIKLYVCP